MKVPYDQKVSMILTSGPIFLYEEFITWHSCSSVPTLKQGGLAHAASWEQYLSAFESLLRDCLGECYSAQELLNSIDDYMLVLKTIF